MKHTSFVKWLVRPITRSDPHITYKVICDSLLHEIYRWMNQHNKDLEFIYDETTTRISFYKMIYDLHNNITIISEPFMDEEEILYFSMKYSDEIVSLFINIREICKNYGNTLFQKNETADILLQFMETYVSFSHYTQNEGNDIIETEEYLY
jgi:hypothetical protein